MNILQSKQSEGEAEEKSVLNWMPEEEDVLEGQLAIDVYQKDGRIIIKSTIAGVRPEDLSITLHNDLLNIKGARFAEQEIDDEDYLYRECYWGNFSRSIILPAEVEQKEIKASLENGILTISLKKAGDPVKIKVEEEESN